MIYHELIELKTGGKTMKKFFIASLLICSMIAFSGFAFAGGNATKDECISMCKKAAAMVKEKGLDATLAEIANPKGQFVWKDSYVFAIDSKKGNVLAHPYKPGLVGKNLLAIKDVNGVMFFAKFVKVSNSDAGEGWVEYMWPKPGEKTASPKQTYVFKVPGYDVSMCAGIYK